jgi:hypothetical protein
VHALARVHTRAKSHRPSSCVCQRGLLASERASE